MIDRFARWDDDGGAPGPVEPEWPGRMTVEELKAFVLGWCDRQVFSHLHLERDEDIRLTFMPIAFGALADVEEDQLSNIGLIWEWLHHGRQPYIHGNPTFWSARCMHRLDWARARAAIELEELRRKEVRV